MSLIAKFVVNSLKLQIGTDGKPAAEEISMNAVYGKSGVNEKWSKWTPSGNLTMTISNEAAFGNLRPGRNYFIRIEECPPEDQPDYQPPA